MNLTTEPWIPIIWSENEPGKVSLREAFERGEDICDLAVRPHERIALMRLLICVAHSALDGPTDRDDWQSCRPRITPAALDYLKRWEKAFELFGDGQRFLQVNGLTRPASSSPKDDNEGSLISKLDLALATGNNTTLFDNAGGSGRSFTSSQLALMLITFQCFSPCGTIGVALWDGRPTAGWNSYPKVKPGQSAHAPCISSNMLHSYLRGGNLIESLYLNMITKDQVERMYGENTWGKPLWEAFPSSPADKDSVKNATASYLGRLVPLSRALEFADDQLSMILANGLEYSLEWREPAATIVIRQSQQGQARAVLGASSDRAIWRELHALTVIEADKNSNGGPIVLTNLPGDADFDLWVGGLVAAGNGKLVDSTESVFHIPAEMLYEPAQRTYEEGVRLAERQESRLRQATSIYHKELGDRLDRPETKKRRQEIHNKAAAQFWTDVEQAVPNLLDVAENTNKLGLSRKWYGTNWGRAVSSALQAAFERACPHETSRQIRAYALGLKALFAQPIGEKDEKNTQEEREE